MTNGQNHWTADPGKVEEYVLGRLGADERVSFDEHLRTCEACRITVGAELQLAAGVRRAGRDELKARLRERVLVEPVRAMPWLQIATAAAVIVLLAGIGIYSDWFSTYREDQTEVPESFASREREQPHAAEQGAEKPADREGARMPTPAPSAPSGRQRSDRTPTIAPQTTGRETGLRDEGVAAKGVGAAAAEEGQVMNALAAKKEPTFWTEGNVLSPSKNLFGAPAAADEVSKKAESKALDGVKIFVQQDSRSQEVVLNQRPARELPKMKRSKGQVVPTLVEKTEHGINLTMYVDTPFSEKDLVEATAEATEEDSLIVNVGDQQIGYRIPGVWTRQAPAKKE